VIEDHATIILCIIPSSSTISTQQGEPRLSLTESPTKQTQTDSNRLKSRTSLRRRRGTHIRQQGWEPSKPTHLSTVAKPLLSTPLNQLNQCPRLWQVSHTRTLVSRSEHKTRAETKSELEVTSNAIHTSSTCDPQLPISSNYRDYLRSQHPALVQSAPKPLQEHSSSCLNQHG
jgi:hypothetical protein